MKILFLFFFSILAANPAFAQSLASPIIGRSANLTSLATREYLSGKNDESLALYQKAIAKSENEYGKNSRVVGDLYYQLGVRAFWLSNFNLAERSFKKAVEINPNCEAAQLLLVKLLRFRNQDAEAYNGIQQGLKKHPQSTPLLKDLVVYLQDKNPSKAVKQAFLVSCIQNELNQKIFSPKPETPLKPKNLEEEQKKSIKEDLVKTSNRANKKPKDSLTKDSEQTSPAANKAIYEPINKVKQNVIKQSVIKQSVKKIAKAQHTAQIRKHANKMPAGLIPPPPPSEALGFPASHAGMRAHAGSIKLEKPRAARADQSAEAKKHAAERSTAEHATNEHSTSEPDPDFLIEWASVKKKTTK